MRKGNSAPRITVTCAGYEGHTCYEQVETTPSHRHDAKCKSCHRVIHLMSSIKYQRRMAANNTAEKGKPGRKPEFGGDFIKQVYCKRCKKTLLYCRCMDMLDGVARLQAWRW